MVYLGDSSVAYINGSSNTTALAAADTRTKPHRPKATDQAHLESFPVFVGWGRALPVLIS